MFGRNRIFTVVTVIFMLVLLFSAVGCGKQKNPTDGITLQRNWNELGKAINDAKNGDVIYVDDIDFAPLSPDEYITGRQKTIDKSITIKSGKEQGGAAVFSNGMFLISGSKISGEGVTVRFENIVFDGKIDTEHLTAENCPDEGFYGHALDFSGNVNCEFKNCTFQNYYHVEGAVAEVRYGDYTADEYKRNRYQDQSNCKLDLTFLGCTVKQNAAFYTGGAFLVESAGNVSLHMTDCTLSHNKCGAYFGMGGGAIYGIGANVVLNKCKILNNQCNYCYADYPMDSLSDNARGGGMYFTNGSLAMTDCAILGNVGTMGGGIALTNTPTDIEGCTFAENKAMRCATLKDELITMPCSLGQGGALYTDGSDNVTVSLTNSNIYGNSADIAYGGIYQFYLGGIADPTGLNYLRLNCCTYVNNTCHTTYDYTAPEGIVWNTLPGNIWTDPNTSTFGCLIVDETLTEGIFNTHQKPTAENGYTYFGSPEKATADGIALSYENQTLSVGLPKDKEWQIPAEAFTAVLGNRYNGKLKQPLVGSNYSEALYGGEEEQAGNNKGRVWLFIGIGMGGIAVFGAIWFVFVGKKNCQPQIKDFASAPLQSSEALTPEEQKSQKQFVFLHFTEEQISDIMASLPEVEQLTKREKEVFREMLLGKKQTEIAEQLYISTSTVKDFYQKIYTKMGVTGKDELLDKLCSDAKTK